MRHCDCSEEISLSLDGLLDEGAAGRLQEHLNECESCRMEWEALHWASSAFRADPVAIPASGFTHRAMSRLQDREARRQRLRSSLRVLVGSTGLWTAVAIGFAVLFGLLWQPLLRFVVSGVMLPLVSRTFSFLLVLGRALGSVARDLFMRPTWLLLATYGMVALGLIAVWTCVVVRPRTRFAGREAS
jgi:anti-sigma factor RsiW